MTVDKCPAKRNEKPCGFSGKAADPFYCPKCKAYFRAISGGKVQVDKADLKSMGLI